MQRRTFLLAALVAAALTSGCARETRLTSPSGPEPQVVVQGVVRALHDGRPYDADFEMTLDTQAGQEARAFLEAQLRVDPNPLPFHAITPLEQIEVGHRVRVHGVVRGERIRMTILDRLSP